VFTWDFVFVITPATAILLLTTATDIKQLLSADDVPLSAILASEIDNLPPLRLSDIRFAVTTL